MKFETTIIQHGTLDACAIEVPFDPKEVWGKVRVPVVVTLNGYSYRSTIASMSGKMVVPFAKEHREASGVGGGDTVVVEMERDDAPRTVDPPAELARALEGDAALREAWDGLSYTHQREYAEWIDGAKKDETRERRVAKTLERLSS